MKNRIKRAWCALVFIADDIAHRATSPIYATQPAWARALCDYNDRLIIGDYK